MADKELPTVAEGLKARSIFPTLAEAQTFLEAQAERFSDWDDQTLVAPAVSVSEETGEVVFDPSYYEDAGREIMIATLKNKIKDSKSTMKAVVMAPLPTLECLLGVSELDDSEPGVAFVREIIRKELNHRAVRPLRMVEDPSPAASSMPLSVESFITSQREGGGLLETFDSLYRKISDTMGDASKAWKKRKLTKAEIRKSMESKGYALEMYPELEEAANGQSLFALALQLGIKAAERDGLDPAIFKHWQDNRDSHVYDAGDEDEEELELDSLLEGMLTDEEEEASEATDSEPEASDEGDKPAENAAS